MTSQALYHLRGMFHAAWYLRWSILYEVRATIVTVLDLMVATDRVGLIQSGFLVTVFLEIQAVSSYTSSWDSVYSLDTWYLRVY